MYVATRSSFPNNTLLTLPAKANVDYVGTGEIAPDIIKQTKFDPVYNDLGGSLPWDYLFNGEEAVIPINLTVFNWSVVNKLDASPRPNGTPGFYDANAIGSLMMTEGLAYHMWLVFPYAASKAIYSAAGMPAGYHFWASWCDSLVVQPGTKANKIRINMRAVRLYQPASIGNGFVLYDHSLALLDGVIPQFPPSASSGAVT